MKGTIAVLTCVLFAACGTDPEPVPPPPVPTPEQCPEGFAPLVGSGDTLAGCYREEATAPWVDAEKACERHVALGAKAHLIVIDRDEEHRAISSLSRSGDVWIGRLQQDPDDEYRNINYIEWEATYFASGEPNDHGYNCSGFVCGEGQAGIGDERCIEYKHETGLWNDEKCHRDGRVLCEWDNVEPYDWRPGN